VVIQTIVAQLEPGPQAYIAGQQTNSNVVSSRQALKKRRNARKNSPIVAGEMPRQTLEISSQKALPVLLRGGQVVKPKQIVANRSISPATERDVAIDINNAEFAFEGGFHRCFAGTAACEKCSVDIEKTDVHVEIIASAGDLDEVTRIREPTSGQ